VKGDAAVDGDVGETLDLSDEIQSQPVILESIVAEEHGWRVAGGYGCGTGRGEEQLEREMAGTEAPAISRGA
jgi:hypothetical protein